MAKTIQESISELHSSLKDYIEATYHISASGLIGQRKELLAQPGIIHQIPYLESTPRYETGEPFSGMAGLPDAALEVYAALSKAEGDLPRLIYDPPYKHQSASIRHVLIDGKNVIIMTGTGSGKTESFLLPIIGKLAREAKASGSSFGQAAAMRALVLYPMNALVNDQLGRMRTLFGDPRLVALFKGWAGRPPRFARYTSRTPYAGVRSSKKDGKKLQSFEEFYVDIERRAFGDDEELRGPALELLNALKDRGKWPAKPNLVQWFGEKGARWQDKTGAFVRAVTLADDSELLTRHEVQAAPPDLLVTNYSMLEYMLMRPIERTIFDRTKQWLEDNPSEKFLVVLDEAHLYRGAAGAEVGLLLRRLRDRLGIEPNRFQVIAATASFSDAGSPREFGAELSGITADTFEPVRGNLDFRPHNAVGTEHDASILASIDLDQYHHSSSDADRLAAVKPLLAHRKIDASGSPEAALYEALHDFGPMGLLVNLTMKEALPIASLGERIFPTAPATADAAVTALMTLGSVAREDPKTPGLLPCRVHNFFRGLPGLWICMDPSCTELEEEHRSGICGRMYGQPRERCGCDARVLELYTCRNCGTAYARAYTDDVDAPKTLWREPGERLRMPGVETGSLLPLDLLLEEPADHAIAEPVDYDLETGRVDPAKPGSRMRRLYLRSARLVESVDEDGEAPSGFEFRGQFRPCGVCGKTSRFGQSYVQDHQTKGDQPFQALVSRQIQIQPPSPAVATRFAPLQGRKVLAFSDSRQVAARLAPNLQMYSVRDSLRPMIAYGFTRLQAVAALGPTLSMEDLYLAVLLASKELNVRLRPELKFGESFDAELIVEQAFASGETDDAGLLELCVSLRSERPPEALLENIITTVQDRFLGFEALALASIVERAKHTAALEKLPDIPGYATTPDAKVGLARAWLRNWQNKGFWLSAMPHAWWRRSRNEGVSVRGQKSNVDMSTVIPDKTALKAFNAQWAPTLIGMFTQDADGLKRLRGSELALKFKGDWVHCSNCKSVHRPIPGIAHCQDCGVPTTRALDPDSDAVFLARKGFYRKPVIEALGEPPRQPMALVAAEHTAQLNSPQNDDVFSKAEENELLFQDIELSASTAGGRMTAIDVLSSTTTMEVGIDLGALSGVALRNMPPGRANYQQRAGRAGRRGNAVATVVAFGSADSHDEHYFSEPDAMIRGPVVDPKLTLDNLDIVRRHVRAFLLQAYHQDRLPQFDAAHSPSLFSVLGSVAEFRANTSVLNRDDFAAWLAENEASLRDRVSDWIPSELSSENRRALLDTLAQDCLAAIDEAIRPGPGEVEQSASSDDQEDEDNLDEEIEEQAETDDERPRQGSLPKKLLDRLLYAGALPRYAFPTDVATFHVFDRGRSTRYRPIMRFAPSQGLPIALSQYAPGKQVWISGKCYTSGAIYSVMPDDRYEAWENKRLYMECSECGFARTFELTQADRGETRDCDACGGDHTFGPARYWLRPPGFAHPENEEEVTSPDDVPETSPATRAKLTMGTDESMPWVPVNERIRVLATRQHLLVSNTGPSSEGYSYCTKCGRIEASTDPSPKLAMPHRKPYPDDDDRKMCDGTGAARHVVLGTDFITDIALFSMKVAAPLRLKPGHSSTAVALRTASEALAKAACQMLEIEPGELMAEFRPALSDDGIRGLEAEIFLYDTLPGGAGFAAQLPDRSEELFRHALKLIKTCPGDCDASCYRCLRSFKNKFEHGLLDRHIGAELISYLLDGETPEFDARRLQASTLTLAKDLARQSRGGASYDTDVTVKSAIGPLTAPILATDAKGRQTVIALSGPLTDGLPADPQLAAMAGSEGGLTCLVENELTVRRNLPFATRTILQKVEG